MSSFFPKLLFQNYSIRDFEIKFAWMWTGIICLNVCILINAYAIQTGVFFSEYIFAQLWVLTWLCIAKWQNEIHAICLKVSYFKAWNGYYRFYYSVIEAL